MDSGTTENLLKNKSFLNYCFDRNDDDVLHWENYITQHPNSRKELLELKNYVVSTGIGVAELEVRQQYDRLRASIAQSSGNSKKATVIYLPWFRVGAVAATLLLVATFGIYYYNSVFVKPGSNYAANKLHDIKAGGNKALLILESGERYDLAIAKPGLLVNKKGIRISKTGDGQLVYDVSHSAESAPDVTAGINTIQTPAKGQYNVILPDGTKVWLNAQTTLTYPTNLSGGSRHITLNGEGYFEVSHLTDPHTGKRVPFIVETVSPQNPGLHQQIEVLGTHFNVNSYGDEPEEVTTLLEGSVRVSELDGTTDNHQAILQPGQALLNGKGTFRVVKADTESAVAWKNGDFVFHEDIGTALRKVARWYDVEIVYLSEAPKHLELGGWISRKNNISDVLNLIEATGKIHLKLDGRRVLVTE